VASKYLLHGAPFCSVRAGTGPFTYQKINKNRSVDKLIGTYLFEDRGIKISLLHISFLFTIAHII
jgi:hypothetical protein